MDNTKFSLNAGELSDEMAGRPDLSKTQMGCETAENTRVLRTGGQTRRAGFKYGADSLDTGAASRLKGFRFSNGQGYSLEFGNLKMRVWKNGELIESAPSTPLEVVTPWTSAQVFALQFSQRVDRIVVTHPDVEPQEITFISETSWTVTDFPWDERIWLLHSQSDLRVAPAATTGTGVTVGAAGALFTSDWVGTRLQFEYNRPADIIELDPQVETSGASGSFNMSTGVVTSGNVIYKDATALTGNSRLPGVGDYGDVKVKGARVYWTCILSYVGAGDYTGSQDPDDYPTFFVQGIVPTRANNIEVLGDWSFETFATWTGVWAIERTYDGIYWSTVKVISSEDDNNELVQDSEEYEAGAQFRVRLLDHDNTPEKVEFTAEPVSVFCSGEIVGYTNSTTVTLDFEEGVTNTGSWLGWKEDAFNPKNGYPSCSTFHQRRLWFGGSDARKQFFWSSRTEAIYDFTQGTLATDGMTFETDADEWESVRSMVSHLSLLVGTSAGVYAVISPDGQSITPENNQISRQGTLGVEAGFGMRPLQSNVLYLQDNGRKIQELTGGSVEYGGYTGVDLTQLSSHITRPGVTQMESGKSPDSAIYLVTGGELAVLTYEREQNVVGFARWVTDGTIESVGVCSGASEDDDIYICVTRDGDRFIEFLTPDMRETEESGAVESLRFLDSYVEKIDGGGFTSITGLDHLEGRTVEVFADGEPRDSATVTSGEITLSESATNAVVGLPYTSLITPMPLDRTLLGSKSAIGEVTLRLKNTSELEVSQDKVNWAQVRFDQSPPPTAGDPAPALFTGDKQVDAFSTWERKPTISIRQTKPLPMTLLAIRVTGKTSR